VLTADLASQKLLHLGAGPMNMAFKDDGQTVVIANHNAGSLSVCDLEAGEVQRTVRCGVGIETLSYY
jgi:hypothetical protein